MAYVLVVIWTTAQLNNYAVLYNSEAECLKASAALREGNTLGDGTYRLYRPIVNATCVPLRR
jgi:hypothetical protein